MNLVAQLLETARKPGPLSLVGTRRINRCRRDVVQYFRALAEACDQAHLTADLDGTHPELWPDLVLGRFGQVVAKMTPLLVEVLAANLVLAYQEGYKDTGLHAVTEADSKPGEGDSAGGSSPDQFDAKLKGYIATRSLTDRIGASAERAATWAAQKSSELVTRINETTRAAMRDAVSKGISEQLGVDGLGRLIRREVLDMSVYRGKMIATTEMTSAFTTAALEKMNAIGTEYKTIVLAPDPCDICEENAGVGPIPITDPFPSGDLGSPFHPNCRCATVPSRPPKDSSDDAGN